MEGLKNILFVVASMIMILSCKDSPTDNYDPPNINDPWDFRLTDFYPSWSPDGEEIAYVHGDTLEAMTGIYIIDTNGTNKRLLISSPSAYSPDWSPDGTWIVFSMYAQIYKIKSTGDSLTQLTNEGRNFYPSWSPDGEWIAFDSNKDSPVGGYRIWQMKVNGVDKALIVDGRMPCWSNDIKWIFYIGFHGEIFKVNLTNITEVVKITHLNEINIYATDNRFPKFAPLSLQIAYSSQPNGNVSQIWIINSDGTNAKKLTDTQGYTCDWSPDAKKIVYTDSRAVNGSLWLMNSDGSNKKQLTFNN